MLLKYTWKIYNQRLIESIICSPYMRSKSNPNSLENISETYVAARITYSQPSAIYQRFLFPPEPKKIGIFVTVINLRICLVAAFVIGFIIHTLHPSSSSILILFLQLQNTMIRSYISRFALFHKIKSARNPSKERCLN